MHTPLIKRALWTLTAAAAALVANTAQAALQDRDLDGNGVTDAFYDTDLDITWLRDVMSQGRDWSQAQAWAADLNFGGLTDWRLPTGDASCINYNCTGSEMGHLWYGELGNTAGAMTDPGGFNWRYENNTGFYRTSTAGPTVGSMTSAQAFEIAAGYVGNRATFSWDFAMAVRDGDVPAIPEPGTYALLLAGLAGLALRRRNGTLD